MARAPHLPINGPSQREAVTAPQAGVTVGPSAKGYGHNHPLTQMLVAGYRPRRPASPPQATNRGYGAKEPGQVMGTRESRLRALRAAQGAQRRDVEPYADQRIASPDYEGASQIERWRYTRRLEAAIRGRR